MRKLILLLNCCLLALYSWCQEMPLPTNYNTLIQSAQVYPQGNPLGYPFFELGTTNGLIFEFDELSTERRDLRFAALLCTYDWQLADLTTSDYIQGFDALDITDIQPSFNTLIEYTHYRFSFPNDMMKLRLSGNYLVVVFDGDDALDASKWQLAYRMVAYETLVQVSSQVRSSSVIADRFKNQEVDFVVQHADYSIYDYRNDLHVALLQNMNWKESISSLHPVFIKGSELIYDFNLGENDFQGGAEFRNFEFKSMQYQSNAVDHLDRREDGYHLILRKDFATGQRAQSSGTDLNGNYYIMNDDGEDRQIESEYVNIHFALSMPEQTDASISLDGQYFRMLHSPVTLQYNRQTQMYEGQALIKQGLIDYRYVIEDTYTALPKIDLTEGCSANAENDYHLIIYNHDRSTGHDRVIAVHGDNSVR